MKVEISLEQREVAFLSPSKICKNLNFSTVHLQEFKFSQILLGDKNTTYFCSEIISTLSKYLAYASFRIISFITSIFAQRLQKLPKKFHKPKIFRKFWKIAVIRITAMKFAYGEDSLYF